VREPSAPPLVNSYLSKKNFIDSAAGHDDRDSGHAKTGASLSQVATVECLLFCCLQIADMHTQRMTSSPA